MPLGIYDSNEVTVAAFGIPLTGYADGEFLTISYDTNIFDDVVGTDGEVARSKTNDYRATVTIKLMQTSPSNALLSAVGAADRLAGNGAGVGAIIISDRNGDGATLYAGAEAWISKHPDVSFDRTATSREWSLRVASLIPFTSAG